MWQLIWHGFMCSERILACYCEVSRNLKLNPSQSEINVRKNDLPLQFIDESLSGYSILNVHELLPSLNVISSPPIILSVATIEKFSADSVDIFDMSCVNVIFSSGSINAVIIWLFSNVISSKSLSSLMSTSNSSASSLYVRATTFFCVVVLNDFGRTDSVTVNVFGSSVNIEPRKRQN